VLLQTPDYLNRHTLDAFSALKDALEKNGVQLIVSLVPDLFVVSSRVIDNNFRHIPDLQSAVYTKQLSEIGVETIYSCDSIIRGYSKFQFAFFFPKNGHPSDTTQDIISNLIASRAKRYNIPVDLSSNKFEIKLGPHTYNAAKEYLFHDNCDIGANKPKTSYMCRHITYGGKPIERCQDAPILVLGNLYIQTPMSDPKALPSLLSMKTLSNVDFMRINGTGPLTSIIEQILRLPHRFLKNKKVLIIQFGTTILTECNQKKSMYNIRELEMKIKK